jgi:uncharacterized SAM-binding protein YcdF (DUF218 family)
MHSFILIYILLSALSYGYGYWFKGKKQKIPDCVIVLSGSTKSLTKRRILYSMQVKTKYGVPLLIACGKEMSGFMQDLVHSHNVNEFIIQSISTNTYEDAEFSLKYVKDQNINTIGLVSSAAHLRRALHTFQRVYLSDKDIIPYPTSDIFSLYSPLWPIGWLAVLVNIYKDYKYNKKIL